jgi:hypothetical protein
LFAILVDPVDIVVVSVEVILLVIGTNVDVVVDVDEELAVD